MIQHMQEQPIRIDYFTDMLCIWAYSAQVRLDELKNNFGDRIEIDYRFTPIFAAVHARIEKGWSKKGGFEGFNAHQHHVARDWSHVRLHDGIWVDTAPASSTPSHLFLKAVQLLEKEGHPALACDCGMEGYSMFEALMWRIRCAFFEQCLDISDIHVLGEIAADSGLPVDDIMQRLDNGQAHAALHLDIEARDRYLVSGSPTYVFNEGRQRLYGNVGYRIIRANVEELLHEPHSGEASWC